MNTPEETYKLPRLLESREGLRLHQLCAKHPGDLDGFARDAFKIETSRTNDWNDDDESRKHPARQLKRIIACTRTLSFNKLHSYVEVLKQIAPRERITTPEELLCRLAAPDGTICIPRSLIPWSVDEHVISQYRTHFHHYHLARRERDKFSWVYTPIDFTEPHPGILYGLNACGLQGDFKNKAFGYFFPRMFVMILKSVEGRPYQESVHVYYDFCTEPLGTHGKFGIVYNENSGGSEGVAGSLIFGAPYPGTESPGWQSPDLAKELTEYWLLTDGPRANRILHLFAHRIYKRPEDFDTRLKAINKKLDEANQNRSAEG